MSNIINTVVGVGTLGREKDITGVDAAAGAARKAGELQAQTAEKSRLESARQFDVTERRLQEAEQFNRAQLQPFQEAGVGALGQQQALLGLSGQEAQQAAFAGLTESPGQKFLRDRQEKALLRNTAAIGGLGGGNVRTALQEQSVGFAQQDIQNQFGRLGQLAGQGQNAATNIGQSALGTAGQVGQFGAQSAAAQAAARQAGSEARASGILGAGQANAQFTQGLINAAAGVGGAALGAG